MAGIKVITPSAAEPVLLADVKPQLRIEADDTSYDDILTPLITAAREWCEGYQNRTYITQTLELALDCWPHCDYIDLPRPPLQSFTSFVFTDNGGNVTIWDPSNYIVDDFAFVARVVKARYVYWPLIVLPSVNGIKVRYVAGYGDSGDDVPVKIKQAIILLVSHWYENGMCDPPPAVYALLSQDRVVPI